MFTSKVMFGLVQACNLAQVLVEGLSAGTNNDIGIWKGTGNGDDVKIALACGR